MVNFLQKFLRECVNDDEIMGPLKDVIYQTRHDALVSAFTEVYLRMGIGLIGISGIGFLGYKLMNKLDDYRSKKRPLKKLFLPMSIDLSESEHKAGNDHRSTDEPPKHSKKTKKEINNGHLIQILFSRAVIYRYLSEFTDRTRLSASIVPDDYRSKKRPLKKLFLKKRPLDKLFLQMSIDLSESEHKAGNNHRSISPMWMKSLPSCSQQKQKLPDSSEISDQAVQGEGYKELKTILENKLIKWTAKTENSSQVAAANLEPEPKSKGKKKRNSTDESSQAMVTEDKCFNSGEDGFVEVSQGQINAVEQGN